MSDNGQQLHLSTQGYLDIKNSYVQIREAVYNPNISDTSMPFSCTLLFF